jgi:hypothetical protein
VSAAAHPGIIADLIVIWSNWWWAILIFGGSALEFIGASFGCGASALRKASKRRYKRTLELKRLELRIAQAKAGPAVTGTAPDPGLCRHRKAVPVRDSDGNVVSWLCRSCETQLPPEFSIYEEDL